MRRIDSMVDSYMSKGERAFAKIDAQGFERQIIEGGEGSMDRICGMRLEMSLAPLYQGETLIGDMIGFLSEKNYALVSIEPAYWDLVTHELLQVDGIFLEKGSALP